MKQLNKRIRAMPSWQNSGKAALANNGTHAGADAPSRAGLPASHHKLILA